MKLRFFCYRKGFFKVKKLPCFVISIGNMVAGGAGKTPMTIYLTQLLTDMGKRCVIVSRGYKGEYPGDCAIVSDGENVFLDARQAGDEPFMMATHYGFPVVVGKDRYTAGTKAIKAFSPDVIILDDAFQHLKLKRDMDLVLLDHAGPFGNGRLLPAGRLREPIQMGMQRACAFVFTRAFENKDFDKAMLTLLQQYPRPWFKSTHTPFVAAYITKKNMHVENRANWGDLKDKRALLLSGIADNAAFCRSIKQKGVNILDHLEFNDHYRYKESDILLINTMAKEKGADIIITTQKDWVKLESISAFKTSIAVIDIQIEFNDPDAFRSFVKERLNI
ncbi:MAG: tetraacyldisaccharide 4'-kinase [Desulfobacula sp.]|nr:tetraacyldisaccharide 4'-kinase [Desulfobacula sp.]